MTFWWKSHCNKNSESVFTVELCGECYLNTSIWNEQMNESHTRSLMKILLKQRKPDGELLLDSRDIENISKSHPRLESIAESIKFGDIENISKSHPGLESIEKSIKFGDMMDILLKHHQQKSSLADKSTNWDNLAYTSKAMQKKISAMQLQNSHFWEQNGKDVFGTLFLDVSQICLSAGFSPEILPDFYRNINIFLSGEYQHEFRVNTPCENEEKNDQHTDKNDGCVRIGRSRSNDLITLRDPSMSKQHAFIHQVSGEGVVFCRLPDGKCSNPSYILHSNKEQFRKVLCSTNNTPLILGLQWKEYGTIPPPTKKGDVYNIYGKEIFSDYLVLALRAAETHDKIKTLTEEQWAGIDISNLQWDDFICVPGSIKKYYIPVESVAGQKLQLNDHVVLTNYNNSTLSVNLSRKCKRRLLGMMERTRRKYETKTSTCSSEEALCRVELAQTEEEKKVFDSFQLFMQHKEKIRSKNAEEKKKNMERKNFLENKINDLNTQITRIMSYNKVMQHIGLKTEHCSHAEHNENYRLMDELINPLDTQD